MMTTKYKEVEGTGQDSRGWLGRGNNAKPLTILKRDVTDRPTDRHGKFQKQSDGLFNQTTNRQTKQG